MEDRGDSTAGREQSEDRRGLMDYAAQMFCAKGERYAEMDYGNLPVPCGFVHGDSGIGAER